ncbi:ABC transporter substrate-binding protein [Halorarius halobius]|uniref:ABC transporter substrate-binding protein n=1 Tax=Halorarius halobius TaxID=2962671 RepID=UPI0020CD129F|nr:ABC transporter substrate-binding protein [Halorarius halobius]
MDAKRLTRRRMLATAGAAGVVGLAGCTGGGTNTDDEGNGGGDSTDSPTSTDGTTMNGGASGTVKIGVLQPLSGDLKYYGQQAVWGFGQGFNYKGEPDFSMTAETGTQTATVGDVDYEMVVRDTQLSADTAQTLATDLVQNEGVDVLFGCTSSASATRVVKTVAKQAGTPTIIGPAASASITSASETCAPNVFRANENTAMDARSGGQYVADNTDVSSVYLFGADYSFGKAVVNNYRTVLEANGIDIVGEKFVPQGYSEWEGLLENAESAGAEGIVAGFTVATLPQLFTTFLNGDYSYRVFGGFATQITTGILGQTLQKVLGKPLSEEKLMNANLGPFTTRYHWNQYDNEINSAFVDSYTSAHGIVPDLFTSGTFTAASALTQAVEASGSTEGADIAAEMRGMVVADTPKGEDGYEFQSYNNQARSAMTIANTVPNDTDSWNAPIKPSDPVATIGKGSTTIPKDSSEMGCNL